MSNRFIKDDSHRMMKIMWGDTPNGVKKAYMWLSRNMNQDVHFSERSGTNYKDMQQAHQLLFDRMIRKGFDYETGTRTVVEKIRQEELPSKKDKKKFKDEVAHNVLELQKSIKSNTPKRSILNKIKFTVIEWLNKATT